jgi:hypothetical protein
MLSDGKNICRDVSPSLSLAKLHACSTYNTSGCRSKAIDGSPRFAKLDLKMERRALYALVSQILFMKQVPGVHSPDALVGAPTLLRRS